MFPALTEDLLEQINNINGISSNTVTELGKTFKFDYSTNSFVQTDGKLTELADKVKSVEQWILLILDTPKDEYNIYKDTDFYCNIKDLKGRKLDVYKRAELEREITESVKKHRYVKNVTDFTITQEKRQTAVSFTVKLIDDSEVEVNASV